MNSRMVKLAENQIKLIQEASSEKKATLIKDFGRVKLSSDPDDVLHRKLYRLSHPLHHDRDQKGQQEPATHVIVSARSSSNANPETYIFHSDKHGNMTKGVHEMPGSQPGIFSHVKALKDIGYTPYYRKYPNKKPYPIGKQDRPYLVGPLPKPANYYEGIKQEDSKPRITSKDVVKLAENQIKLIREALETPEDYDKAIKKHSKMFDLSMAAFARLRPEDKPHYKSMIKSSGDEHLNALKALEKHRNKKFGRETFLTHYYAKLNPKKTIKQEDSKPRITSKDVTNKALGELKDWVKRAHTFSNETKGIWLKNAPSLMTLAGRNPVFAKPYDFGDDLNRQGRTQARPVTRKVEKLKSLRNKNS